MILDIVQGHLGAEADPRWSEFGAASRGEYAFWSKRACGIACLKMTVEALGGPEYSLMEWIEKALLINGFIFPQIKTITRHTGWIHQALASLANMHGLKAGCSSSSDLKDICRRIDREQVVVASVSCELGERGPIAKNIGHFVLLHGYSLSKDRIEALLIHNPSGRYHELRESAWIPASRFASGFSNRIIFFEAG